MLFELIKVVFYLRKSTGLKDNCIIINIIL